MDSSWNLRGVDLFGAWFLDGPMWHGLRGLNFERTYYTREYSEQTGKSGYAGLDDFIRAVVVQKGPKACKLVCTYYQEPSDWRTTDDSARAGSPLYREESFYEIVASIRNSTASVTRTPK